MVTTPVDSRRAARLQKVFRDVTKGGRAIATAADARLFLEAIWTNPMTVACLEFVTASDAAQNAIRHSLRIDPSASFIRSHVMPFIAYLSDPSVKLMYNGQLLRQLLLIIAQPPILWGNLMKVFQEIQFDEAHLHVFAWLCFELARIPGDENQSIISDISAAIQQKPFQEAQDHKTRALIYRTKKVLALRSSNSLGDGDDEAAGGRHDNDFVNFRDISIFPTNDEFHSSAPPFYRRAVDVAAIDVSERPRAHLDNQFRLLREDMLGELREDFKVATGRKRSKRSAQMLAGLELMGLDTGDEQRGRFCSVLLRCRSGLQFLGNMTTPKRQAFLDDNKWFLRHQSFGALCGENRIVAFAFLIRDVKQLMEKPPVLTLQFTSSDGIGRALTALQSPSDLRFILVGTPVFAYQPVLECLQEITEMPLEGQLVHLQTDKSDTSPTLPRHSARLQTYIGHLDQMLKSGSGPLIIRGHRFDLDHSQTRSLLHALQSSVSLIQGPPGTGKSFVGALAAKILLTDPGKRILVLSFTNHALDQFLEDLMKIGISSDFMVRLGSKSSEETSEFSLETQIRRSGVSRSSTTWEKINNLKMEMSDLREKFDDAFKAFAKNEVTPSDILTHLEFNAQEFFAAFQLPEQDSGFQFAGKSGKGMTPEYLYDQWVQGRHAGQFHRLIPADSRAIWQLPVDQRRKHEETWVQHLRKEQVDIIQQMAQQLDDAQDKLNVLFDESKCELIHEKRLIGCTTTAAAKYKSLVRAAEPDIVLVEEAGEILEAHVLAALHCTTSQLILIGDHKQLRPKINNYGLSVEKGDGFDLNRSLFERLILQGHEHTTLLKQHRMHPAISALVREMTYPDLLDDEKTLKRPEPKGLQGRVSFVNHSHPEDEADEIADRRDAGLPSSKKNQFEAEMILKLVRFLGQQGYKAESIVVLTPYLGQLRLLRDLFSQNEHDPVLSDMDASELIRAGLITAAAGKVKSGSGRIKLSTIDNYQGEEADVVIASLTRSNNNGDVGFMKAPERLNVLCSRARECLIMFGNMETFMASPQGKPVWLPFFKLLKQKDFLHDGVAIRCQQHPEKTALLECPEDFEAKCPDGGCDQSCNASLSCGRHTCQMRCHRIADHTKMTCHEKLQKTCDRGHHFSVPCTEKDAACKACFKEDEDNRRRIERDLKMEKERLLAQRRYAKELQEIQDEVDHEKRRLKYAQEEDEQKKQLDQARADLKSLRETRSRAEAMKAAAKFATMIPGAFPATDEPDSSEPLVPGSAQEEWLSMKTKGGATSSALDSLMSMIGLESVKQEFLSIKSKVDTAVKQGVSLSTERFGCTLLGNPGTGKTTVARIYSKFLTSVGVIAGSTFKEFSGSQLASMGVSGCQKILDDIMEEGGGVLFIDEAYQLSSGNSPGGRAVLDFLLAEVENLTGKIVFILAGYSKQMESFFAHNPGFPSRFPIEMKFDDYDDDELERILRLQIHKKYGGRMKWDDDLYLRIPCRRLGRGRGKEGFGNARAVENMLAVISSRQANRLRKERRSGLDSDNLMFTKEDLIGPEPANALSKCEAWARLQSLIGLASVKSSVKALVDSIQTNYRRELAEEPIIEYTLNKVFLGSPGTGKTTVAKLYGQILVDLGLLSNGEVVVKNPADFVGAVLGGSEAQTKGILASTVGKVLVIDEAYGLYGGGGSGSSGGSTSDPYKTAVVDTIVAEVQSVPGEDRCVLLLGYKDQMEEMFQNVNPGLSRRFPLSSAFNFEDLDSAQLRKILDLKLKQQGFSATDQAKRVAMEMLDRARNRPNFGNAGEVDILLNDAKAKHQSRLSSNQTTQLSTLEALDFDENFDRAERAATNVAKLFEGTVGCELIVAKLEGFQQQVQSMKELGMDPKENIPFNFLFRGPPGTGKTSTAKKMGKVFYDMGFLAKAEVVECSASDLIGQYVGHTGPKVQQLLDKALGRVLFVDEAYRLADGGFAKEAVDELVDCVTKDKYKGRLVIILAGYDNDINRLLSINPGMSSRFPEVIDFHSLSAENCYRLLLQLLLRQKDKARSKKATTNVVLDCLQDQTPNFKQEVISSFGDLSQQAGWASARDVESLARSVFSEALKARRDTCITITEAIIEKEMHKMFAEREGRAKQAGILRNIPELPILQRPPSTLPANRIQTQQQTTKTTTTAKTAEETECAPPESPKSAEEDDDGSAARVALRDAGVSDEDWEQLELDKRAQQERDDKYRDLLKAHKEASDAAREAIVEQLLEEEELRRQEAEDRDRRAQQQEEEKAEKEKRRRARLKAQRKAAEAARDRILKQVVEETERREKEAAERAKAARIGKCSQGFAWIKQASGYRCAGGSHFVTDQEIARL